MAINPIYFMRESLVNFRRNWVMSLGAVITIYLSLLLVGIFVVSGMFVNKIVESVERKVTIQVFIKDGAAEDDVVALQQSLLADSKVKDVKYVSKEEALERFKKQLGPDSQEIIRELEGNPLPASLDVELKDPHDVQTVVDSVKAHPALSRIIKNPDEAEKDIKYGQQIVEKLFAFTRVARIVESVFIAMLAIVSLIFIGNTIRLAIYSRRKEIGIMRLVGASNWFIRLPFLFEGLIQGLIGAVLAIATLAVMQATVVPELKEAVRFLPLTLSRSSVAQLSAILVVGGMLIGLTGSGFALRRYLRV